jgi:hypothetical protein
MRTLLLIAASAALWTMALNDLALHPVTNTGTQPYVRLTGPSTPLPP